jgi:hypothetical protein
MTRINAGVHPSELPDKLLLAEHREITRIPNSSFKNTYDGPFTLGKGHVLFFRNKMGYLKNRYLMIYEECIKRGFKVTDRSSAFKSSEGDWDDSEARQIIIERINNKNFELIDIDG